MSVKIFICYAHEDEVYLKKLKIQLTPMHRQGLIEIWHDRDISAGTDWEREISEQLNSAQIILLLVSPDFMASDYCYGTEMKRAIERHNRKEARVIPVILRPVHWEDILGNIQALPADAKPVMSSSWHSQDDALFDVAEGIRKVIKELEFDRSGQNTRFTTPSKRSTQNERQSIVQEDPYSFPLHFIWIVDCGSSMSGDKMQSLNTAIRESIPEMRKIAQSNPHTQILIRAIKFSDGARWHIAQPTPIEEFQWVNLTGGGKRDIGEALFKVAEQLRVPPMGKRAIPPVLVLITDGSPSDNFELGLNALMAEPWGRKAVRIAIGIGANADYDRLQKFIGNPEIKPLHANNADQLVSYIKWADETIEDQQEFDLSLPQTGSHTNLTLPPPPPPLSVWQGNVFILGRPGSGKTTAIRYLTQELENRGWFTSRINEYEILRNMFQANLAEQKFIATEHGGFDILDFAIFSEASKEIERTIQKLASYKKIILIELARDEYKRALKQFDIRLVQDSYFLFIDADVETCIRRIHQRVLFAETPDDYFVSDTMLRRYYHKDNWEYMAHQFHRDFDILKNVLSIKNMGSQQEFLERVKLFAKLIDDRENNLMSADVW